MRITYKYKFNKSRKQQFIKMIAAILLALIVLYLALPEKAESRQALNIGLSMPENVDIEETPRQLIIKYANIYGIDPALALAISRLETGNWTSEAYITKNNFGGLTVNGSVLSFESREEGAKKYINTLFETYIMNGLTSPETIGPIYCPPNADDWVRQVNKILDEERKEELKW